MTARFRKRGGGTGTGGGSGSKGGRGGKVAAGSIAATVVGAVIKDLSRPNGIIRGLVAMGRDKLLARREAKPAIDVSKAVEVEFTEERASVEDATRDQSNGKEA